MKGLIVLFFIIFFTGCMKPVERVFIFPIGFEGFFAIVYDQNVSTNFKSEGQIRFVVPDCGVLRTAAPYTSDISNDIFLLAVKGGFDTLKTFFPPILLKSKRIEEVVRKDYTSDLHEVAVNFRQMAEKTVYVYDSIGHSRRPYTYRYEFGAVGSVDRLGDAILDSFVARLDAYMMENLDQK